MKLLVLVAVLGMFVGCSKHGRDSDASAIPPHDQLVGTTWKLKTDAYIIEFENHRGNYIIIPCDRSFGSYINYTIMEQPYDEKNVGKKFDGVAIVGGLRAGEALKIIRVLKNTHIEMGTRYIPMMIPEQSNRWTGDSELSGHKLYRGFYEKGVLNPDYAEKVE